MRTPFAFPCSAVRRATRRLLLPALSLLLFASSVPAQEDAASDEAALKEAKTPRVDGRLRAVVEAAGLRYDINDKAELQLVIEYDSGRSQGVSLQSKTLRYDVGEQRDIYSLAHRFGEDETPDPALLQRLLGENNTFTLGFWALQDRNLYVIARIPARASPLQVKEAVYFVAEVADGLERELSADTDAH